VSRSTVPRPLRWRSGSIPHDAVADPPPHRRSPLRTALARQRSRLRRPTSLARGRTANPIPQRAIRSFKPLRTSKLQAKTDRIAARGLAFPTLTPPPNPHSPRCTVGAPHGDFVPWRFSDAGWPSAGIASVFRRPKTCTSAVICNAANRARCGWIEVHVGAGFKPALGQQTKTIRWQRGYYEHVIRNETALDRIRAYIANNPTLWADDLENILRAVSVETGRV
jgi:hypothetical protein